MQNFRNYYELLEVSKAASASEIKQAYRRLARQYHPDLNPGNRDAEEHFKLLSEAYDVLSDNEKRTQYERYSKFWNQKGFSGSSGLNTPQSKGFGLEDIDFGEWADFNRFVDQVLKRHGGAVKKSDTSQKASADDVNNVGVGNQRRKRKGSRKSDAIAK